MLDATHIQIAMLTLTCLIYPFLALTERYCSSDIRKEESIKLSKYNMMMGGLFFFMLLFFTSLIFYEKIYLFLPEFYLNSIPIILTVFIIAYFGLASKSISSREAREIKKVKLADEIYLDRSEDLKLSDLFLNRYKFNAEMIKRYGKGKTAGFYSVLGYILFITFTFILYNFFFTHSLCFYLFIFVIFIAFSLYGFKKNKENLGKAIQLASDWSHDDFKNNYNDTK